MTKRTAPRPVPRTAGPTIQERHNSSDRVSPAYAVDEDDPDRVSNLCDIGAHDFCDGIRCACSCHRRGAE